MLKDKIVVISGAGAGLGRELSVAVAERGAKVIGLGRSLDKLEGTREIVAGDVFECYQVDVSHADQVRTTVEQILEKHGRIDVLFNNAAVYPKESFLDESMDAFNEAVAINVGGVANLCKAILPFMVNSNSGRIINLGSWAHLAPIENAAVYSCTKSAVHCLTKAIAADLAHAGSDVEVHEWIPGHLNTQMSGYTGIDPALAAGWGADLAGLPAGKKNAVFEQNWEYHPPLGLKQKIKKKLFFWK